MAEPHPCQQSEPLEGATHGGTNDTEAEQNSKSGRMARTEWIKF